MAPGSPQATTRDGHGMCDLPDAVCGLMFGSRERGLRDGPSSCMVRCDIPQRHPTMRNQVMFAVYVVLVVGSAWSLIHAIRTARASDFESREEIQRHPIDFGLTFLSRLALLVLSVMGCAYQLGVGVDPLVVLWLTKGGHVVQAS